MACKLIGHQTDRRILVRIVQDTMGMGAETLILTNDESVAVQANGLEQGIVRKTQIGLFSGVPGYRLVH